MPDRFPTEVIIWGAGSISKKLIENYSLEIPFFISGLDEEDGRQLLGKTVFFYKSLKNKSISDVLITVENLELSILALIRQHLKVKNVFFTKVEHLAGCRRYSIEKL